MRYSIIYNIIPLLFLSICLPLSAQDAKPLSVSELFKLGMENSLRLKDSQTKEIISSEKYKTALNNRLPTVQAGATAGIIGQPIIFQKGLSHPMRPDTPDWSQSYSIRLTQPLYQGGKIQYTIQKADIEKKIATLNTQDSQAEIKLTLLQHYMELFSLYKQREVLARNIEESEVRLKDIRRMRQEGLLTRNDEIRSELQLTNDRIAYQETGNSLRIISQQLDILLGLDENLLILPDTTLLYKTIRLDTYESYVVQAYENYPGIQIARQYTLLAQKEVQVAKASLLPALSLYAGNTLARPLDSTPVKDMFSNGWNIGLSLTYDLSSFYQNKHKIREAKQHVNLSRNAEEQTGQDIRIQLKTAYLRHKEAIDRIGALKLSVRQAEENYRIVQNRYLNQLSILTDLLDASNIRLDAKLQLTVARTQAVYTYYNLQRICGNL